MGKISILAKINVTLQLSWSKKFSFPKLVIGRKSLEISKKDNKCGCSFRTLTLICALISSCKETLVLSVAIVSFLNNSSLLFAVSFQETKQNPTKEWKRNLKEIPCQKPAKCDLVAKRLTLAKKPPRYEWLQAIVRSRKSEIKWCQFQRESRPSCLFWSRHIAAFAIQIL